MLADGQMQGIAGAQGQVEARQQPLRFRLVMAGASDEFAGFVDESRDRPVGTRGGVGTEFAATQPDTEGRCAFRQPPVAEGQGLAAGRDPFADGFRHRFADEQGEDNGCVEVKHQ